MTTAIAHELVDPNPKDCEKQLKWYSFFKTVDVPKRIGERETG